MLQELIQYIQGNSLVGGGAILGITGFALAYMRQIPGKLANLVRELFTISVTVRETDDSFVWVSMWLSVNFENHKHAVAHTVFKDRKHQVYLSPAPGNHFGWYKRLPFWISRNDPYQANSNKPKELTPSIKDEFRITFFGRDKAKLQEFIEDCRKFALPDEDKLLVYLNNYSSWYLFGSVSPRSADSLAMADGIYEDVLTDLEEFISSKDKYESLGIPYHRGYLLHGPPGNGKTSLVKTIASTLKLPLYILNLSSVSSDTALLELMYYLPMPCVLLMEDIDCVFESARKLDAESKLTFSGILNCLDGQCSKEGQITFLTTNHIERLDPALIRPGRIDRKFELNNATAEQIQMMKDRIFPQSVMDFSPGAESMAEVQNKLMLEATNARICR